jgi:hypothetical protein
VRQQVFGKLSRSQKINDMTLSLFLTANSKGSVPLLLVLLVPPHYRAHSRNARTHARSLYRACPFIELDFSSMKWVSASTVIQLFNPYTLLHLNLSNCTQITDEVYERACSACLPARSWLHSER